MKTPLPNTYWVEPGRLLAGEHPDGGGGSLTRARIEALMAAGVRSFVDLTQPQELASYREHLPAGLRYSNFPMVDHSLPQSPQQMREVQRALKEGMRDGAVYVHCRAGIGRTGVAVGCYLRENGESGIDALARLNALWQQNARAASWPTVPETEEQERYVREWHVGVVDVTPRQRYRGCLLALAIGDALANAPESAKQQVEWTDETGMTQCLAESFLACDGFDGRDQLERYRQWAADPHAAGATLTATLRPVVRETLVRALRNRSAMFGSHDPAQLDPSPLARSAAAALFAAGNPAVAGSLAADSARVTHQVPVMVDACRLLAAMIARALAGKSREAIIAAMGELGGMPLRAEVQALAESWQGEQGGRRKPPAAALGVLDRAVRCFIRSRSIADGLTRALDSPGDDKDAICAVYGALAGAYYGAEAIGTELYSRVAGLQRLEQLADQLHQHRSVRHGLTA